MQTTLMAKHDAAEIVRRFEMSTITLHEAHREWLTREISAALEREGAITPITNLTGDLDTYADELDGEGWHNAANACRAAVAEIRRLTKRGET